MSYKDKYGITEIIGGPIDNLSINWDADKIEFGDAPKKKRYPVLLFTPNMDNVDEHFHIQLAKKEATRLRDWLDAFLKDSDG